MLRMSTSRLVSHGLAEPGIGVFRVLEAALLWMSVRGETLLRQPSMTLLRITAVLWRILSGMASKSLEEVGAGQGRAG